MSKKYIHCINQRNKGSFNHKIPAPKELKNPVSRIYSQKSIDSFIDSLFFDKVKSSDSNNFIYTDKSFLIRYEALDGNKSFLPINVYSLITLATSKSEKNFYAYTFKDGPKVVICYNPCVNFHAFQVKIDSPPKYINNQKNLKFL